MAKERESEKFHRALVLQGGGALGAYEAGVLKEWCSRLVSEDRKSGRTGPVFDIVAGCQRVICLSCKKRQKMVKR